MCLLLFVTLIFPKTLLVLVLGLVFLQCCSFRPICPLEWKKAECLRQARVSVCVCVCVWSKPNWVMPLLGGGDLLSLSRPRSEGLIKRILNKSVIRALRMSRRDSRTCHKKGDGRRKNPDWWTTGHESAEVLGGQLSQDILWVASMTIWPRSR